MASYFTHAGGINRSTTTLDLPKEDDTNKIERILYKRSVCTFDVALSNPILVVKGLTMVGKGVATAAGSQPRRICVEIWTPSCRLGDGGRSKKSRRRDSTKKDEPKELVSYKEILKEGEKIRFRILKPKRFTRGENGNDDGGDEEKDDNEEDNNRTAAAAAAASSVIEWEEKGFFMNLGNCLDTLQITNVYDLKVDVQINNKMRILTFTTKEEANKFHYTISDLRHLEKERLLFGEGRMTASNITNRTNITDETRKNKLRIPLGKTSDLVTTSAAHWDVKIAPAVPVVKGVPLVSSLVKGLFHFTKRRIRIEIWTPKSKATDDTIAGLYNTLVPPAEYRTARHDNDNNPLSSSNDTDDDGINVNDDNNDINDDSGIQLNEDDKVRVRFLKYYKDDDQGDDDDDDDDDDGVSATCNAEHTTSSKYHNEYDWIERSCKPIDSVVVRHFCKSVAEIEIGKGLERKVRIVSFKSKDDAQSFYDLLLYFRSLERKRGEELLKDFQKQRLEQTIRDNKAKKNDGGGDQTRDQVVGSPTSLPQINDENNIVLLVEIVSALKLPRVGAFNPTDPFVVARLGRKDLHQTDYISDTFSPIWTVKTGSLFLLRTTAREFFIETTSGVTFVVYDYNTARSSESLGRCRVTLQELLSGDGKRIEHDLVLDHKFASKSTVNESKLVLRYRQATQSDIEFMSFLDRYERSSNRMGFVDNAFSREAANNTNRWEDSFIAPKITMPTVYSFKKQKRKKKSGQIEYRVKPGPDPERIDETKWMTKEAIDVCSKQKSQQWIEAGSGKLGKIFFELLSCDNLPDFDVIDGVTDAFATICYEDTVVNTEVINDTLRPRWPPWSQRAFIFHVSHPSSQIHIGLFDLDKQLAGFKRYQFIGRVTIDITNASPDTIYTLDYTLYRSNLVEERETSAKEGNPAPTVKIRFRLEWYNARDVVMAAVKFPPQQMFVNIQKKRDFISTYETCNGTPNVAAFSLSNIWSYINMIEEYQQEIRFFIEEGMKTIFLWRGHYPLTSKRNGPKLPIHSIIAFFFATTLAENVNLLPSYICFGISWFLLATMWNQHTHPSPWRRCIYFRDILSMLLLNKAVQQDKIEKFENESLINVLDIENNKKDKKIKRRMEEKKEKMIHGDADVLEAQEQLNSVEETDRKDLVTGFRKGWSINPLESRLHPYQLLLEENVGYLHVIRSIVSWQECYVSFLITIACVALGFVLLFVPWSFIIHLTSRVLAWTCFGPWMKLLDPYVRKLENMTREDRKEKLIKQLGERYEKRLNEAQIRKEDTMKTKAMAQMMFGKYGIAVPNLKRARHIDYPLPTSTAEPYEFDRNYRHIIADKKMGQNLSGDMIPLPQDEDDLPEADMYNYLRRNQPFRRSEDIVDEKDEGNS